MKATAPFEVAEAQQRPLTAARTSLPVSNRTFFCRYVPSLRVVLFQPTVPTRFRYPGSSCHVHFIATRTTTWILFAPQPTKTFPRSRRSKLLSTSSRLTAVPFSSTSRVVLPEPTTFGCVIPVVPVVLSHSTRNRFLNGQSSSREHLTTFFSPNDPPDCAFISVPCIRLRPSCFLLALRPFWPASPFIFSLSFYPFPFWFSS